MATDLAPKLEAEDSLLGTFFNREGEDSYLKHSHVKKKKKQQTVYLINNINVVLLSGKVVIFCCFLMP